MSLTQLYTSLMQAPAEIAEPLSTEMQHRIYRHCSSAKDWHTMRTLALYPGLDPQIEELIKGHNELEVLVAWATRPGRTAEELSQRILKDKRVNVLLPLAEQPDLPAEVYATIAKVQSPKLSEVLAGNPSVPLGIRLTKLRDHVTRHPRGASTRHNERLHKLCVPPTGSGVIDGVPAEDHVRLLYEAVAETTLVAPYVYACLERGHVRESDLERWLLNFSAIYSSSEGYYFLNSDLYTMMAALTRTAEQRTSLIAVMNRMITKVSSYRTHTLQRALNDIMSFDEELETLFVALSRETDGETCGTLAKTIRARCRRDEDIARLSSVVAQHPYVPTSVGLEFLSDMNRSSHERHFVQKLERQGEIDALLSILRGDIKTMSWMPSVIHYLDNPEPVIEAFIAAETAVGEILPDWIVTTSYFTEHPEIGLTSIRWEKLSTVTHQVPRLANLVEHRILAELGDDPMRWEAFNSLAQSFNGNLEDLLGAAKALSQ